MNNMKTTLLLTLVTLALTSSAAFAADVGTAKGGATRQLQLLGRSAGNASHEQPANVVMTGPAHARLEINSIKGATRLLMLSGTKTSHYRPTASITGGQRASKPVGTAKGGAGRLLELTRKSARPNFQVAPLK
jgi:hypothetical protein